MISRNFAIYLDEQSSLVSLLPEQPWLDGTTEEKKKASIFWRRAGQDAITPFIIVGESRDYDDGTHTSGVDGTKVARFTVTLAATGSLHELTSIRAAVLTIIRNARSVTMNGMRVQCLIIENVIELNGVPVDGGEAGLPGYEIHVKAGFQE